MDEPCERAGPRNDRRWCWWRWDRTAKPWGYRGDLDASVFDRLAGGWLEEYDGGERKCRVYLTWDAALDDREQAEGCPQFGYDPGELHVGCPRCRGTFREPTT